MTQGKRAFTETPTNWYIRKNIHAFVKTRMHPHIEAFVNTDRYIHAYT